MHIMGDLVAILAWLISWPVILISLFSNQRHERQPADRLKALRKGASEGKAFLTVL